jgi:hypothetical protein
MSKACGKCGGRMEQGFVPESKDSSYRVDTWFEGAPQKRWYGLKTGGLRKHEIETWRCGRCGFLESYAPAT